MYTSPDATSRRHAPLGDRRGQRPNATAGRVRTAEAIHRPTMASRRRDTPPGPEPEP
eukprot:SAG22_NODE_14101_length_384_cov_1.098246_1_plen_56_part_10